MSKRDNPRLWAEKAPAGKNRRGAHSIGKDGRLHKDEPAKGSKRTASARGAASENSRFAKADRAQRGSRFDRPEKIQRGGFHDERRERPQRDGFRKPLAAAAPAVKNEEMNPNLLIGRNPVMEAVKSGRTIDKILMQRDGEGSIKKIAAMARDRGVQIQYVDKIVLDKMCPGRPHQGIAAYAAAHDYVEVGDILSAAEDAGEDPFIVILDGLEDPHNLGAILRSADGAGAHGIIIPSRRSVSLTETVAKSSAGAIEYVPVAKVNNLASTIDQLKERGIWVAAVDMDGADYHEARLSGPLAIVIGGEGQGVSRLIKEKCDFVVSIPMRGKVNSLNASNAAAIILYEAEYQRNLPQE